jgi:hypothetical protein
MVDAHDEPRPSSASTPRAALLPAEARVSRLVSLPHEHGGYLTLVGATVAGAAVAGAHSIALAVGFVAIAAFFARAPVEQLVVGRPARDDRWLLALLTLAAGAAAFAVGTRSPWAAFASLAVAVAIVSGSLWARLGRTQRAAAFELVGMTALGALSGVIAIAGGAPPRTGVVVATVLGVHAGLAIPLVRTTLRRRERQRARRADLAAMLTLLAASIALVAFGAGRATLALVPRALHLAGRSWMHDPVRPRLVGILETIELAACATLLVTVGAR